MNRTVFAFAGVFGTSSLLLADAAVKGTALVALAAIAAAILRRDSAATRHLVWLLAMAALLVAPGLAALLPQWRVLPEWAGISPDSIALDAGAPSIARPTGGDVEFPRNADPIETDLPPAPAHQSAAEMPDSRPALVTPQANPKSPVWSWNWLRALPLLWAIGFSVLVLRLLAARWLLLNTERQGTVIGSSRQGAQATDEPLVRALEAACLQFGICRPVTLLIHPEKAMPVVWGILRCRLLLPAAARQWSGEQLRSVLLHELAHVKRRDTLAQLLTQVACAMHWFNPLVWFAAWRLGVERERACDDLVLANGVRPSAYAGHLLEVVTRLVPAPCTQSCGLAMARKSSLEGRLVAVLSENLNRRRVSMALTAIALAIAAGIAVPIAMLRAADEQPATPPQEEPQKPKDGAKLEPGTEDNLKWGQPVNGMRTAIMLRPSSDKPKAGGLPDLFLVLQNVSNAPIRLSDTNVPPNVNLRMLYFKKDGVVKWAAGAREPTLGDLMLQPREVAFLPIFSVDSKKTDGKSIGQVIVEGMLKDPGQTLFAELEIEKAPAGAWTGKLVTGETGAAAATGEPQPKKKEAQMLYKMWQNHERGNGNIPGGLVRRLGEKVKEFIRLNTGDVSGDPSAKKMAPLVPRLDSTRDWTPAEVVALLDDNAAASTIPLETTMQATADGTFIKGEPLPPHLANAPWGEAQPSGLRVAWLLEPRATEYRLGTPLKSRILFHNAGKNTVIFRTRTWHQSSEHKARDAKDAGIQIVSTYWTTIGRLVPFRLAPGEFVEVTAAGIGVGANKNDEDWKNTRVGSWIEANPGDDVTFTPAPVLVSDWNEKPQPGGDTNWWLDLITTRLSCDLPLPTSADERNRMLDRAVRDLFGTAPTAEESAAFLADREPNALDSLAKRLAKRTGFTPFTGSLTSGPTKFRVLPADPDAAKKPRTASNPGRYTLGEYARLAVSRRPDGERIVNEASIEFYSKDPTKPATGKPHAIKLPDGYNTWAAAWLRGTTVLWVLHNGTVRSYDFTDPAQVKETTFQEPANLDKVPRPILEALQAALDVAGAPKQAPAASKKG